VATLRVRNGPDGAEKRDFRSSPNNGYCQTGSVGPVRAMKRLMRRSTFAEAHPETIDVVLDAARDVYAEAAKDIRDTAKTFSAAAGFPEPVMELALSHRTFGILPISSSVIAEQQRIPFKDVGPIPGAINVSDAAHKWPSHDHFCLRHF
jgi:hypothetical protein